MGRMQQVREYRSNPWGAANKYGIFPKFPPNTALQCELCSNRAERVAGACDATRLTSHGYKPCEDESSASEPKARCNGQCCRDAVKSARDELRHEFPTPCTVQTTRGTHGN